MQADLCCSVAGNYVKCSHVVKITILAAIVVVVVLLVVVSLKKKIFFFIFLLPEILCQQQHHHHAFLRNMLQLMECKSNLLLLACSSDCSVAAKQRNLPLSVQQKLLKVESRLV